MADKTAAQIRAEEEQKKIEEQKKLQQESQDKQKEAHKKAAEEAQRKDSETHRATQKSAGGGRGTVPGAMSTYSDANQVGLAQDPRGPDRGFTRDEIKSMAGDIERGQLAHIRLDENGTPTGQAFVEIPHPDEVTAPVAGTPVVQFDELVTPTGAPITKYMNPDVAMWDAGMLERNPPPEDSQPGKKPPGPIGGGVVNQPVTA